MKILIWLLLSLISGCLYRLGGIGKPFNTKYRDIGCPLVLLGAVIALFGLKWTSWWVYLATFGLSWGALTTYWKKKGEDAKWWNWALHGFFVGLSTIPCMFLGISLYVLLLRTVVLSFGTMLWSEWQGNVFWEEFGRGFLIIVTIPILLI